MSLLCWSQLERLIPSGSHEVNEVYHVLRTPVAKALYSFSASKESNNRHHIEEVGGYIYHVRSLVFNTPTDMEMRTNRAYVGPAKVTALIQWSPHVTL